MQRIVKTIILGMMLGLGACSEVAFELPQQQQRYGNSVIYNNKVDIIWMVDNSSSMLKHQQSLSAQIPNLVAKLKSLKLDINMAVVTSSMGGEAPDGGRFIGTPKYLNINSPQLVESLSQRLIVGEAGSNNERGLESIRSVLSPNYLRGEGQGFLRDDAMLVVIAVSDEEDKAPSSLVGSNPVAFWTNYFDSVKAPWPSGIRSWVFNFIGVTALSSNCRTFNDYAEVGLTFMGLAQVTDGLSETICSSNLSAAVGNINSRIIQIITDYHLDKKPQVETITVYMGDVLVPRSSENGWDYIPELNLIRFYGSAVPSADMPVVIDFKPADAN